MALFFFSNGNEGGTHLGVFQTFVQEHQKGGCQKPMVRSVCVVVVKEGVEEGRTDGW